VRDGARGPEMASAEPRDIRRMTREARAGGMIELSPRTWSSEVASSAGQLRVAARPDRDGAGPGVLDESGWIRHGLR